MDPEAQLYLNDYAILTGNWLEVYVAQITELLAAGVRIDGIGVQGHSHGDGFDSVALRGALDRLAEIGLPICVTEFNFPGQHSRVYGNRDVVLTAEEEAAKAQAITDYYRICFANPAVKGVLMWGFWEGANWIPQYSLFRRDWSATPAGEAYRALVFDEWWTRAEVVADERGMCRIPAFYGTYRVQVGGAAKSVVLRKSVGEVRVLFR